MDFESLFEVAEVMMQECKEEGVTKRELFHFFFPNSQVDGIGAKQEGKIRAQLLTILRNNLKVPLDAPDWWLLKEVNKGSFGEPYVKAFSRKFAMRFILGIL